ncbi:type II secretion system F family protein [Fimbriiglobus ruber]|uniref:Flp pilus assembly protein TadB n=1 Tax=Fimbriiglobus ruber TaxID=1908690 RepID=A0A225DWS2_9BACT|nr:type II secretion system F family protein [Fimbriiglobus ruber]OWK41639.1 Flp pilus assembly protein TadB [Fimbriiglobus ruber]
MLSPLVLSLLVGALVVAAVFILMLALVRNQEEGKASERLDLLVGRGGRKDSSADLLLKQALQEVDKKNVLDKLTPEFFNLPKVIEQADANIKPGALFGIGLVGAVVLGLVGAWMVNPYVAPVTALGGLTAPFIWLFMKRTSRLKNFAAQLPDAMELVARALRAGHSLAAGMHVVADEMPAPVSKEFGRVYEEQNLGIPLEEALKNMCDRVPNLDLKFFVTSVAIQRQTGGDLAEILDRIGYVIRERFKILGQVKALTAEGRLSGIVLVALPIGLFLLMLWMKPDYVALLWKDPIGVKMSIGAVVLMLIGSYSIKKIIDIKV